MTGEAADKRKELCLYLLKRIKEETDHLHRIMADLGESSGDFLGRVYQENCDKIREKVQLFNQNVEKVKGLNNQITNKFNEWYGFIKDDKELKSLLFPIKLHARRNALKTEIREIKREITATGIKSRLIREDIQRLEGTLEYEATMKLKKDVRYEDYLHHINIKSRLIDEVLYLLPTIPGVRIRELYIDRIEEAAALLDTSNKSTG